MNKNTILKMIDTYMVQLKELKKDISKMDLDMDEPLTDDELVLHISKLLEGKRDTTKVDIITKVAILNGLSAKQYKENAEQVSMYEITEEAIGEFLLDSGYTFTKRNNPSNKNEHIISVSRYTSKEAVSFDFDEDGYCNGIRINKD